MRNILLISYHEWQQKRRSGLLMLMFFSIQALLLVILLTGWTQYNVTKQQQQDAQAIVQEQWLAQPDRHPHRVAHFGHFTFRPPSALSFFDNGINHFVGNSIYIEAHKQNSAMFSGSQQSDVLLRFSDLSVSTVLLLCWPLLLIALGYNCISAEYTNGTLKQLFAMSISPQSILAGKALTYLFISVLFIVPVFLASTGLIVWSDIAITGDVLLRIASLFLLYLGYCAIWVGIVLLISSVVRYAPHALALLIAIWFVLTIVSPRILADFAADKYSFPSRNAFNQEIRQAISKVGDSHNPDDPHFSEFKMQILAKYQVDRVEDLPVNYRALVIQEGERISAEIYTQKFNEIIAQQQKQQAFIRYWYWLNPYLLVRDLSMAISATDVWHFYDYERQTEQHRFARISKLNEVHAEHIDQAHDRGSTADALHWQSFNDFHYQPKQLKQSLMPFKSTWLILAVLIGLLVTLFILPSANRRFHELA